MARWPSNFEPALPSPRTPTNMQHAHTRLAYTQQTRPSAIAIAAAVYNPCGRGTSARSDPHQRCRDAQQEVSPMSPVAQCRSTRKLHLQWPSFAAVDLCSARGASPLRRRQARQNSSLVQWATTRKLKLQTATPWNWSQSCTLGNNSANPTCLPHAADANLARQLLAASQV
jgi:hypothetical protein